LLLFSDQTGIRAFLRCSLKTNTRLAWTDKEASSWDGWSGRGGARVAWQHIWGCCPSLGLVGWGRQCSPANCLTILGVISSAVCLYQCIRSWICVIFYWINCMRQLPQDNQIGEDTETWDEANMITDIR
jgi:hypothetical protein